MPGFNALSQYVCAECGSVLKETDTPIEIATIVEDCPNCGASLANTLKRQAKSTFENISSLPKLQTAYDLTRFKLEIEKVGMHLPLSTTGSLCIVGHNANLLLTRLCVRALLPANHGGLDSPHVLIVDAGNKSDYYQTVNFVRQYGLDLHNALDRIIVSRTFTIHQLKSLLQRDLPKMVQKYQARVIIVPGLLDLFEDPNIKKKEAKRIIQRIMQSISALSNRLLVIASLQKSDYADMILPKFEKRITLSSAERKRLNVDIDYQETSANVTLAERDLKIVSKR